MSAVSGYLRGDREHVEGVVEVLRGYADEHDCTFETAGGTTSKQDGAVRYSTYFTITPPAEGEVGR